MAVSCPSFRLIFPCLNDRFWEKRTLAILEETIMNSARKNLGWFLLGLCSPHVLADQTEIEHRTVLAPTMAVFYAIDNEGRSVLEAPSVPAISIPNANVSRSVMRDRPRLERKTHHKRKSRTVVSIRVPRTIYDAREAFRCEKHGFYYTTNGRCVLPKFQKIQNP